MLNTFTATVTTERGQNIGQNIKNFLENNYNYDRLVIKSLHTERQPRKRVNITTLSIGFN